MLPYGRQHITQEDVDIVVEALRAPMLTQGPGVAEFEAQLAAAVGAEFAVAFNSGTAALHAAYFAAGVGDGADVLTSPITFVATVNASLYLGGGAVMADVEPNSILLDPAQVERVESQNVRVLAPVHFGGQVADLQALSAIAADRGWTIVEDAAHALGASYMVDGHRHMVGGCSHSAMCCFSFHPVKHITTGEGGAVTTNDPVMFERLARFRTHGITRDPAHMVSYEGPWYYEQHDLGFNYRITDLQCALGRSQLSRLYGNVERRRAIAKRYDDHFASDAEIEPLREPTWSTGSFHLYVVRVPPQWRRRVFEAMRRRGIGVNVHYIPVPHHPYHRDRFADARLPNADSYYGRAITLPMFPELTDGDVDQVVMMLRESLDEMR